jgi:malonyl CoA-acyl carrier protein transacylase
MMALVLVKAASLAMLPVVKAVLVVKAEAKAAAALAEARGAAMAAATAAAGNDPVNCPGHPPPI